MKKMGLIFSAVLMLFSVLSCGEKAQIRVSKNKKAEVPVDVYVSGGKITHGLNYPTAGYWKNGEWVSVNLNEGQTEILSMCVSGKDVYSVMKYLYGENYPPCYFKNSERIPLPLDRKYVKGEAYYISVSGDDIIVVGECENRKEEVTTGYWKNGKWFKLVDKKDGYPFTFRYYKFGDDIYSCGDTRSGEEKNIPCYQKNKEIILFDSIEKNEVSTVTCLFVDGNDVYAGGYSSYRKKEIGFSFTYSAPVYWKNGEFVKLPPLYDDAESSCVNAIAVYNGDVYAAGYSTGKIKRHMRIAGYWKNGEWIGLNKVDAQYGSMVMDICIYNGDVYAAGTKNSEEGEAIPGYWKNGEWIPFGGKIKYAVVTSIVVVPRSVKEDDK